MELITAQDDAVETIMRRVVMRSLAFSTILAICEGNQLGPADLERLARELAQREANADARTGRNDEHYLANN